MSPYSMSIESNGTFEVYSPPFSFSGVFVSIPLPPYLPPPHVNRSKRRLRFSSSPETLGPRKLPRISNSIADSTPNLIVDVPLRYVFEVGDQGMGEYEGVRSDGMRDDGIMGRDGSGHVYEGGGEMVGSAGYDWMTGVVGDDGMVGVTGDGGMAGVAEGSGGAGGAGDELPPTEHFDWAPGEWSDGYWDSFFVPGKPPIVPWYRNGEQGSDDEGPSEEGPDEEGSDDEGSDDNEESDDDEESDDEDATPAIPPPIILVATPLEVSIQKCMGLVCRCDFFDKSSELCIHFGGTMTMTAKVDVLYYRAMDFMRLDPAVSNEFLHTM